MGKVNRKKILEHPGALEEIRRHCWIESEKAGGDIGFDCAVDDWIEKYSRSWMEYHGDHPAVAATPKQCSVKKETPKVKVVEEVKNAVKKAVKKVVKESPKKRNAKSYSKKK